MIKRLLLTALLVSSVASADHHHGLHARVDETENDRMSILWNFGIGALVSLGLNKASAPLGLNPAVQGVLQTTNVLWQLGSIAGNPAFNDLAARTVFIASSAAIAAQPSVQGLAFQTPFIGDGLKKSGTYTPAILTVAFYKFHELALGKFCERFSHMDFAFCPQ